MKFLTGALALVLLCVAHAGPVMVSGSRCFTCSTGGGSSGFTPQSNWTMTGTASDGQIVTLTYSLGGLSIPTDPRPTFWAPLESGTSKDSTYSKSTTAFSIQTNAAIQSTIKPTNAAGALDQRFDSSAGAQPGGTNPDANFFKDSPVATVSNRKCYVFMKRYRSYDGSNLNGKNFRIWETAGPGGTTDIYIKDGFQNASAVEGSAFDGFQQHGGNTPFFTWPFIQSAWWTEEFIFKESTLDTLDGFIDSTRNGGWAFGATNRAYITKSTGFNLDKVQLFFSQYSNPGTNGPANNDHEYLSSLYVNSSGLFRVVASSESTYRTTASTTDLGVKREVQLPVQNSGSSSGVQILLRKGEYSSMSGLYLYLIDDNETVYYIGRFTWTLDVPSALDTLRDAANDTNYSRQVAA